MPTVWTAASVRMVVAMSLVLALCTVTVWANRPANAGEVSQPGTQGRKGGGGGGGVGEPPRRGPGLIAEMTAFHTEVPATPYSIILCNPTGRSAQASVISSTEVVGRLVYSRAEYSLVQRTPILHLKAGEPVTFTMDVGLGPDGDVSYTWEYADPSDRGELERESAEHRSPRVRRSEPRAFSTVRTPGHAFTFTMIADSHLDAPMTPAVYERTLANALADKPDFHVDLGDTFMTDKRGREFRQTLPQYVAQRYYLGTLCHSAPLFMVLGNHDGEAGYANDGPESIAAWSFRQRTKYFPAPVITDGVECPAMYTGRTAEAKGQGANYYAFTWGDAQFIVLDPFWFTTTRPRGGGGGGGGDGRDKKDVDVAGTDDNWSRTLGQEQYDWLTRTLERSTSKYKFVFIHHLVGGLGRANRGGMESSVYFEWGGQNADGSPGFVAHRPGWAMPIHDLLVQHHVAAVFHGHDHLYVRAERDGLVYQCVPQPGNVNGGTRSAGEYGYRAGTILGSPGHVRVSVTPTAAKVEFVRSVLENTPGAKRDQAGNRAVVDSYEIKPLAPKAK